MGAQHPKDPRQGLGVPAGGHPLSQGSHLAGLVLGSSTARPAAAAGQGRPPWFRDPQGDLGCGQRLLGGARGQVAPGTPRPWGVPGGQQLSSPLQRVPAGRGWSMSDGAEQPQMRGDALLQPALPWRLLTLKPINVNDVYPEI